MADGRDPRLPVDPAINTPGREGLTGTAPANLYAPVLDREQITIAPDFAPIDAQPAWRQDFPIDWPQDLYVERRDFMKFMVLTRSPLASSGSACRTGIGGKAASHPFTASPPLTKFRLARRSASATRANTSRASSCV